MCNEEEDEKTFLPLLGKNELWGLFPLNDEDEESL